MKTFTSFLLILLIICPLSAQINPVQNLEWEQGYYEMQNIYFLTWEEPYQPHDELIGYNIYREDELYQFQTETGLSCYPDFGLDEGCGFLDFNDGLPFIGFVAAVYKDGIESEYVPFEVYGYAIGLNEIETHNFSIFPNPVQNTLYFKKKAFNISIFDMNGKLVKTVAEAESIKLNELATGNYIVRYSDKEGNLFHKRMIKK